MIQKVAISYPAIYESVKKYFAGRDVDIVMTDINNIDSNYDLAVVYNESDYVQNMDKVINIHPSLLPAFPDKNAIEKAFNSGVKVSGVTIHSKDKIIAQYPVLIGIETHIDEFMNELLAIEKKLLPPVIDSLLNDKVFDFGDLFSNNCSQNGCSNCKGCH